MRCKGKCMPIVGTLPCGSPEGNGAQERRATAYDPPVLVANRREPEVIVDETVALNRRLTTNVRT